MLAGLLFLLLGLVSKIGGVIEVSRDLKRWAIPVGLLIFTIGLVLYYVRIPGVHGAVGFPPTGCSVGKLQFGADGEGEPV